MWIFGEEVFSAAVDVGEVAAASPGDEDLFADAFRMVEQDDAATTTASLQRAHHAGCARSQDYDISLLHLNSPLHLLDS